MKKIVIMIKRVCIGIFGLYSVNVLFKTINILIPINVYTIIISSSLGFFGILSLIILKFLI